MNQLRVGEWSCVEATKGTRECIIDVRSGKKKWPSDSCALPPRGLRTTEISGWSAESLAQCFVGRCPNTSESSLGTTWIGRQDVANGLDPSELPLRAEASFSAADCTAPLGVV